MDSRERDKLITSMRQYYRLSEEYSDYARFCEAALPSLQEASSGASFLYDSQTANVCGKVYNGIHPSQALLDRMCLQRQNLNTDIDLLIADIENIRLDALQKSYEYESKAYSINQKLQWG